MSFAYDESRLKSKTGMLKDISHALAPDVTDSDAINAVGCFMRVDHINSIDIANNLFTCQVTLVLLYREELIQKRPKKDKNGIDIVTKEPIDENEWEFSYLKCPFRSCDGYQVLQDQSGNEDMENDGWHIQSKNNKRLKQRNNST